MMSCFKEQKTSKKKGSNKNYNFDMEILVEGDLEKSLNDEKNTPYEKPM